MRATEYLFLAIVIGIFSFLSIQGALELNQKFPDNQINTSGFPDGEKSINRIEETANKSYNNFQVLSNEDTSWFQKISSGIVAIPYAVVSFPVMIGVAITSLISMMVSSLGGVLPSVFILAMVTFIIVEVVKRFLEFYQRSRA